MQENSSGPIVIGWREWAGLPDLGINALKVKIDTGASTSSLHAFKPIRFLRDDREWVRFAIHPVQGHRKPEILAEAPVVEMRKVRSSNGAEQWRPVIETRIQIGHKSWPIELTLANRDQMGFRMLLGRQALRRHCLIDPVRSYLQGDREGSTSQ